MRARHLLPGVLLALAAACTTPKPDVPIPVFLACNEVHEILKAMPFEHVERTSGTVSQPLTAKESPGCRIVAKGSRSRLSVLERTSRHSPDGRIKELLPTRGWRENTRFAADRPDGGTFAFDRGGVACYFAARWNGGDDTDPETPGPDRYELSVRCALSGSAGP